MSNNPALFIAGLAALLPLTLAGIAGKLRTDTFSWGLLGAAVVGGTLPAISELRGGWSASLSASLDIAAAAVLLMFAVTAVFHRSAVRIGGLVGAYCIALVASGEIIGWLESPPLEIQPSSALLESHVVLAVASYGAITLAAIATCAVLLLERALKSKTQGWSSRTLPALDEVDAIHNGLLKASTVLMFFAIVTGAGSEYQSAGHLLAFTHKVLLSILAFVVLCALLLLHHQTGLRGRRAARWLLAGFLLLTLAYPGVKFVRGFLVG